MYDRYDWGRDRYARGHVGVYHEETFCVYHVTHDFLTWVLLLRYYVSWPLDKVWDSKSLTYSHGKYITRTQFMYITWHMIFNMNPHDTSSRVLMVNVLLTRVRLHMVWSMCIDAYLSWEHMFYVSFAWHIVFNMNPEHNILCPDPPHGYNDVCVLIILTSWQVRYSTRLGCMWMRYSKKTWGHMDVFGTCHNTKKNMCPHLAPIMCPPQPCVKSPDRWYVCIKKRKKVC